MDIEEITPEDLRENTLEILAEAFKYENKLTRKEARNILEEINNQNGYLYGLYIDDEKDENSWCGVPRRILVSVATIYFIKHLIKNGMTVGLIENVATHKDYRGFGYGRQLIQYLNDLSKKNGYRKNVLYCSNDNIAFYRKSGMRNTSNLMSIYFE